MNIVNSQNVLTKKILYNIWVIYEINDKKNEQKNNENNVYYTTS